MERRVLRSMPLFLALLASGAGVSCGSGIHDADEAQSMTASVGIGGAVIEFMGVRLNIWKGCLESDASISLTWHRKSDHTGARSAEYVVEVPSPDIFQSEENPTITISTDSDVAANRKSAIGFLEGVGDDALWIPDQPPSSFTCEASETSVCGPVQTGGFRDKRLTAMHFAVVQKCASTNDCRSGEACAGGACNRCSSPSNCAR